MSSGRTSYFGTGIKIVGGAGIAYLLWLLFRNTKLPWSSPGSGGWNPWGGGGNAAAGKEVDTKQADGTANTAAQGGSGAPVPGGSGKGGSGKDTDGPDMIVTDDAVYAKGADGKYYDDQTGKPMPAGVNGMYGIYGDYTRTSFINAMYAAANRAKDITGIFPETMFAQAFIEGSDKSGSFSDSPLVLAGNNYFGIKATPDWTGKTIDATDSAGNTATWRAYDSAQDSIVDYYNFLIDNSR